MTAVVIDGIVLGLAFGLLGVGLTLVYGLGGVLNLAYGAIACNVAALKIEVDALSASSRIVDEVNHAIQGRLGN